MRKIVIEIECGDNTCGECKFLYRAYSSDPFRCESFGYEALKALKIKGEMKYMRLPECLAAEVKEEEAPCSS